MTNEELDRLIAQDAISYNDPPPVPRDLMWNAIESARHGATVVPIHSLRNRTTRWLVSAAGIAAILMVGVVIGRYSRTEGLPALTASNEPAVVQPAAVDTASTGDTLEIEPASPVGAQVAVGRRAGRPSAPRSGARDFSGDDAAYRVAVLQHLTRTEVLLTSFQTQARTRADTRVLDSQFGGLTRDLLGTTRLMLATHRNDDPTMTRLLEDLELVLMQISQYATGGRPIDLDAASQSIDKRNVITKLRSTIPAGT